MKKIISITSVLTLLVLAGCSAIPPETSKDTQDNIAGKIHGHADTAKGEIAPAALYQKLQNQEKFILLDVREEFEYEEAHIPNTSLLIPLKTLTQESLNKAGINKNDEIILYCRSGTRSAQAQRILQDLGYNNVLNMNGGIIHWMEDEFPTSVGKYVDPKKNIPEQVGGPGITFDRTIHDFGQVPQFGGKVQTVFTIKNIGTSTLELGNITTSCACTEALADKKSLQPGEETALKVVFDPNLHDEPLEKFKRTIFIPTNDPKNPEAELTIEVDILENQ
jgi:rhodanese-related sulfurtransferase